MQTMERHYIEYNENIWIYDSHGFFLRLWVNALTKLKTQNYGHFFANNGAWLEKNPLSS